MSKIPDEIRAAIEFLAEPHPSDDAAAAKYRATLRAWLDAQAEPPALGVSVRDGLNLVDRIGA